ncbi:PucR-like helix-turn-helix protein [Tamaricihabitans halophyticus]|uniref:PucR-like helix-turn-helix protein n=1 Tax=Tamaricihabitans halophyticus TaxID=1262583 RepID=A0A4R2R2H0_9PSEU|nr:PucR family transcriptional regulator [Tamaricihabitans halophyticus]TCP56932.1 PucR-like helix-turn-helix protein [Tamaricihabitans halophyticus]
MKLTDLLADVDLSMDVLVGDPALLDRSVRTAMTTDLPEPGRYLAGGELVVTGMVWRRTPADSVRFVEALVAAGVAALAAGDQYHPIPDDLVRACELAGLPLLRVPADVPFATVTEHVNRLLTPRRTEHLATVLSQHRHLVDAESTDSAWLGEVLGLVRGQLGLGGAVLTATGKVLASAGVALTEQTTAELLREYLGGRHLPDTVAGYTLYGVADAFDTRLVGWFLVFEGNYADWTADQHRLAAELAALVGTGYRRMIRERRNRATLAAELLRLVSAGAEPAELQPRLELAGFPAESEIMIFAARLPGAELELAARLLGELVGDCVATLDDAAIVFVAVPEDGASALVRRVRAESAALAPGLAGGALRLGASAGVSGAGGLRGALDEARHACRLAELTGEPIALTSHEELSSHMLLLAAVPDDVRRSFHDRVLGKVLDYDRVHGADLVSTLRAFLASSGGWTKCAAELHMHVNTLRYRIQRVEQLTGRDLSKIEDRVDFFLALALD